MSLKTKIPLILVTMMAVFAAADYLLQEFVVLPQFLEIEQVMAARDIERCKEALAREVYHLDRFCLDWAAWDDMHAFVEDQNEGFVEKNLPPMTFLNYDLNMLYIINREGRVLWGKTAKAEGSELVDLPPFFPDTLARNHPLLSQSQNWTATAGLVMSRQGPMMLSAQPILTSLDWTRSNGTLIIGRFVESEFLETLGRQTHVDVSMWPLDGRLLPPEAPKLADLESRETLFQVSRDNRTLEAYQAYPDVYGKPAILFRVVVPREVYQRGRTATHIGATGAILAGLITLLLGVYVIRRTITTPLLSLSRHVTGISGSDTLPVYHAPSRADEIGVLSQELNAMILRLRSDLEQRQRAEQAVRDREQRLQTLLETAPDGILTVDESGAIETANAAAATLLGQSPDALLGRAFAEIAPASGTERVVRIFQELLEGRDTHGFSRGGEIEVLRSDGATVPVHMKVSVVALQDRKLCTAFLRDLTEFKLLHERMLQAQHLAAIGEMGASVAHEIRNPLAGISGVVQVLLKDTTWPPETRRILEQVLTQVARVENTVRQLLDYAKQWQPNRRAMKVLGLLRAMLDESGIKQRYPGIALRIEGDETVEIYADPGLMGQVWTNLTENAAQAMAGQGTITWNVRQDGEKVHLEISDDGPGLKPEARAKLFHPFFTTKTSGTGLGLAICRRILEAHQGVIEVQDRAGAGVTVTLTFERIKS